MLLFLAPTIVTFILASSNNCYVYSFSPQQLILLLFLTLTIVTFTLSISNNCYTPNPTSLLKSSVAYETIDIEITATTKRLTASSHSTTWDAPYVLFLPPFPSHIRSTFANSIRVQGIICILHSVN